MAYQAKELNRALTDSHRHYQEGLQHEPLRDAVCIRDRAALHRKARGNNDK